MPFLPDMDMEYDPDGSTEQVAVVMKGKTYRDAGLNKSKFPNIEGPLYDKLCEFPRHKYRDEVRKLAMNIAIMDNETNFKPSIEWLDNFMRRFCISRKKSGLSYKKNFLKIKGSKNKSQLTALATKEAESFPDDSHALETSPNKEILSETSSEILAINLKDPLDLGEEFTAFKASNGVSENSSVLGDDVNGMISNASDETTLFDRDNFNVSEKNGIGKSGNEKHLNNNNDNGDYQSDSDDSIKEIPRECSPEKEVINLIESDDENGLAKIKEENVNTLPSDYAKPTEESKMDSNDLKKSKIVSDELNKFFNMDSDDLKSKMESDDLKKKSNMDSNDLKESNEQKDDERQKEKTGNESGNGDKENEKTGKESGNGDKENEKTGKESGNGNGEDVEDEEEDVDDSVVNLDDDEDTNSDSEDSESGSDSEKGDNEDDLVVKQRKSWEDVNHVDYTKKEEKFYKNNISGLQKKLDEKITQCTACFEQVNHTVKEDIFTHPVLGVLVCKKCSRFYGKGNFNKDAEGYDEYCRWCANGGDLLLCDHCTNGFCKKCIKRNLGRTAETEAINSLAWKCYVCDLSPLTEVRAFHRAVLDQLRSVSILNKTLSRKEKKEWSIKQKFSALKIKRKSQGFTKAGGENSKEALPPSVFEKATKEIQELCFICLEQVDFIVKKSLKDKSDDAETRGQRRLLRLSHHMEKNFEKIKASLGESSGLNVEEILLSNSQHNTTENNSTSNKEEGNKKKKNNSHQNPDTTVDSSKEAPQKQTEKRRRTSSTHEDGHESPPNKRIVMETDEEMETEAQEADKTTAKNNNNNNSNNNNDETKESNDDNDLPHTDSSNERDVSDAPIDDAASSKNPDGDTDRDEIEDETSQSKKSSVKLKPSSQKSMSDSESDLVSQSLLKDVEPSQNVGKGVVPSTSGSAESKDKGISSDDSNSSKKGIIYRKSKTLKKRLNEKSDKELSDEVDNSDENLSKNDKSKETSGEDKLKENLMNESDSNSEEDKGKKVKKTKDKETNDDDSKLKNELMKDSDSSDDEDKKKKVKKRKAKEKNESKSKKELTEVSDSSDDEDKKKKRKKKKAKEDCDSKEKNNLKSLLDTDSGKSDGDSDSDLENILKKSSKILHDKSKKSSNRKKKNYKPRPKSVQEAIKSKQLKASSVKVEKLPESIQSKLEEEEHICITDFPEYFAKDVDLGLDSESDDELDAILKSKTEFLKKRKLSDVDSENDADSEDNSQSEDEDEPKEKEKEDKKPAEKKMKKEKKNGLMDISLENEEGDNNDSDDDSDEDDDAKKKKSLSKDMKSLLVSSEDEKDEEIEDDALLDSSGETLTQEELEKKKREIYEKNKEKLKKDKENNSESDNEEILKKVKKKGFLSFKFSTSEEDDEEDEESEKEGPRKARMFIESDSDFEISSKKKKKDFSNELFTSSSDDSEEESESSSDDSTKKSRKSKSRKRIKRPASSTEDDEANDNDLETPKKRHRRIIRDEDLLQSTKDATQEEKERRDRVKERQSRYNKMFLIDVEKDQSDKTKLVLDFNEKTKEELVKVNDKLVSFLKPHQHDGIKFMWDTTVESVERLEKGERGGGCILAHCMGLGKTLQVIAFIHTLLTSKHVCEKISRVLVCCPVNTVYNWKAEFKQWLRGKLDTFDVIELVSAKDLWAKAYRLEDWYKEGGVCLVGYDMFRNYSNEKNKRTKGALREKFQKYLVNPGADLMVCDEGHILKNEKTALSIAINRIQTRRRIILTGTPLQNNLKEYHCMIQFVKPNLLGSRKEFLNRFVNPIEAGQCGDASKKDVSRMKKRAHILHSLLEGCVQRFDYTVLKPFLPPKYEYVISVQMSKEQIKLYSYYLDNLAQGGPKRQGSGLFVDVNNLSRIWSHPVVLFYALVKFRDQDLEEEDGDGNLDGFINDSDTSDSSEGERRKKKKKKGKNEKEDVVEEKPEVETKNAEGADAEVDILETPGLTLDGKVRRDWYKKVVDEMCSDDLDEDSFFNRVEISGKLYLLFEILREASSIGDKVLLFSQSIMVLDMIQEFLRMLDQREIRFPPEGKEDTASDIPQPYKHWIVEKDYYRLDGSTPAELRKDMCKSFNSHNNDRCRLFLISTRAGGVGINLVAANRVIIFDTSWNPSHDTQSIFRVYRFGQKKPCYVYRFVAQGTMEEKIYSRQVTKISTSRRVVDEHQIKRHFNMAELTELYQFTPSDPDTRETPAVPEDKLLAELLIRNKNWIVSYHEQDSLLENQTSEGLTEEERNAAWEDYENEKKGIVPQKNFPPGVMAMPAGGIPPFDIELIYKSVLKSNPNATQAQLYESVYLATEQIQRVHISQFQNYQAVMYNMATNPMVVPELIRTSIYKDRKELIQHYDAQLRVLEGNIQAESNVLKQIGAVTNRAVSHSAKIAAGLVRGNPSSAGVSSTAQYVNRNIPVTNLVNVNTNTTFKPALAPRPLTSAPSTSSSTSSGAAETSSKSDKNVEITLE